MHRLNNYDLYIFDCDGVILDSNQLKIEAMEKVLKCYFFDKILVDECIDYFRNNFGKSRFHHIKYFLNSVLRVTPEKRDEFEKLVLSDFSKQCRKLYLKAELAPGFMEFLKKCKGRCYVASGSEQEELRDIFEQRGLSTHFEGVYGSPKPKVELIKYILDLEKSANAIMFGDAESDMLSAQKNQIDFAFCSRLSNVKEQMFKICVENQYLIIDDFTNVRF